MWLKTDASVDVVAFFILRTTDRRLEGRAGRARAHPVSRQRAVHRAPAELRRRRPAGLRRRALRPRPRTCRRSRATCDRRRRADHGGRSDAFVCRRHYAHTAARHACCRWHSTPDEGAPSTTAASSARYTEAGRAAPVLGRLRELLGEELPEMPGVEHRGRRAPERHRAARAPRRARPSGAPMPVLALGEAGNGRTIALAVDGSHRLALQRLRRQRRRSRARRASGTRLLGWLMRDPRFEPALVELPGGCIAGDPPRCCCAAVWVRGRRATARAPRSRCRRWAAPARANHRGRRAAGSAPVPVELGPLEPGGYAVTVRLEQQGSSAPSRLEFACEAGGTEWADPRPDADRLAHRSGSTGGVGVGTASWTRSRCPGRRW